MTALATLPLLQTFLKYSPGTGLFSWIVNTNNVKNGDVAGSLHHQGYIRIRFQGRQYLAHRLAWLFTHGIWPKGEIDHINGVRDDNRICNLRDVPKNVNQRNRLRPLGTNPYPNVKRTPTGRWAATFKVNRKSKYFGTFDTPEQARAAALAAKERLIASARQQLPETSEGGGVCVLHDLNPLFICPAKVLNSSQLSCETT